MKKNIIEKLIDEKTDIDLDYSQVRSRINVEQYEKPKKISFFEKLFTGGKWMPLASAAIFTLVAFLAVSPVFQNKSAKTDPLQPSVIGNREISDIKPDISIGSSSDSTPKFGGLDKKDSCGNLIDETGSYINVPGKTSSDQTVLKTCICITLSVCAAGIMVIWLKKYRFSEKR